MGRVAREIGRLCPMLLRMQLRPTAKKLQKTDLPTQLQQIPPTCDKGPCQPSFYCSSTQSCSPPQQNPNPVEPSSDNHPQCCPVTPQASPPLCCHPPSLGRNCSPSGIIGCLGGCPLEGCSPRVWRCHCSNYQQPCCPQQYTQPRVPCGNGPFCQPPHRVVCCCCPMCGSPPFNMTGPPPCCTPPNNNEAPPTFITSSCYGTPSCYGAPACFGGPPCYGAPPCYGSMANQPYPYPIPYGQSNLNTEDKVAQDPVKVPIPEEHACVENKKEIKKQEVKSK